MIKKNLFFLVAGIYILLLSACASNNNKAGENEGATVHAVKSKKLNIIMNDLNNIVFERFYSEIEKDNMKLRYSKELSQIASELASDIKKIGNVGNDLNLDKNQKKVFMMMAKELQKESEHLQVVATNYETEKIKPTLDRMLNICNRCHLKYRKTDNGA